ncbi:NrtR DNA-binding winged helix domain-containing protein [Acetobacter sp. AN02]|uniref:NrtR DNA-binding winged helix domain-containing protein n=1 Tax=Acetobacter sp. AN02 TaxID=2894186 RepID=UPI0038CFC2AA
MIKEFFSEKAECPPENILECAILALAYLRKNSPVASAPPSLLPEEFSMPELQIATEGIRGKYEDRLSFRRNTVRLSFLEETGSLSDSASGRPARLYRFTQAAIMIFSSDAVHLNWQPAAR